MSLTIRIFSFLKNSKEFFQDKSTQRYAMFVLSFFLIIGFLLNSYSVNANNFNYDIKDFYEHADELSTATTGVEGKHSHKSQSFQMTDFAGNAMDLLYPQANSNYSSIVANPDISLGAKMGIVGAIDIPVSAILYNPPNIDVTEHLAQEWVPNYDKTASGIYAQESGYQMLMNSANISDLWGTVRNLAYMFFVIVFIIAGFMIMFRHKIGGQMMVTLYNTLPNIVVGLILVTFSFAIVGLMLDVGAVIIRVISGVLEISDPIDATSPFGVMDTYIRDIVGNQIIQAFTDSILSLVAGLLFLFMGSLIALLIMIAVIAVIVFISIKIFFVLIKAYISILFDTIAAPIVFAIATVPGKRGLMKDWFNRVAKNITVFVLVFTLINLPIYFINQGLGEQFTLFGGDLSGSAGGVGGFGGNIIMMGVSIYLLFLAANVPKMLEDYFPQTGGKSTADAAEGAKKDMSKIPLLGGFFKG